MITYDYNAPVLIVYNPPVSRAYFICGETKLLCSIYETWYFTGITPPQYPVPAIPLEVRWPNKYPYINILYIDALHHGEDDPQMVWTWDWWNDQAWYGDY
jgi:hypothetical protein